MVRTYGTLQAVILLGFTPEFPFLPRNLPFSRVAGIGVYRGDSIENACKDAINKGKHEGQRVSNNRKYRFTVHLALWPMLILLLSCQTSVDKARNELEPVYRSAKLLREQLRAGANLEEFNRLRGNFATELSIIGDRMQAKPATAEFLRPYFSAYGSALDAYSLGAAVWGYRSAMEACTGTEPGLALDNSASLNERIRQITLEAEWMNRTFRCVDSVREARKLLNQRSGELKTQCAPDVELHLDCLLKFADRKATDADTLLMSR